MKYIKPRDLFLYESKNSREDKYYDITESISNGDIQYDIIFEMHSLANGPNYNMYSNFNYRRGQSIYSIDAIEGPGITIQYKIVPSGVKSTIFYGLGMSNKYESVMLNSIDDVKPMLDLAQSKIVSGIAKPKIVSDSEYKKIKGSMKESLSDSGEAALVHAKKLLGNGVQSIVDSFKLPLNEAVYLIIADYTKMVFKRKSKQIDNT